MCEVCQTYKLLRNCADACNCQHCLKNYRECGDWGFELDKPKQNLSTDAQLDDILAKSLDRALKAA